MTREEYLKQVEMGNDTLTGVKFADHQAKLAGGDYGELTRIARAIHRLEPITWRALAEASVYLSRGDFDAQLSDLQRTLACTPKEETYKRERIASAIRHLEEVMRELKL